MKALRNILHLALIMAILSTGLPFYQAGDINLDERVDLGRLAEKYELAGGAIMNVVRFASLKALANNRETIFLVDVEEGIRRELVKEGRTM